MEGVLNPDLFYTGTGAQDLNDHIIYDYDIPTNVGVLYYDADGIGGDAQVQIATLGVPLIASTDFIVVA